MTAVPKKKYTPAEYLALEAKAEYKSQYFQGEIFAMAAASRPHNRVKDNLILRIGMQLMNGPCQTFSSDQRIHVDRTGLYTYPDVIIVCGEIETAELDENTITNPKVIIEILSDSTQKYDRGAKFRQYQQIPSFTEYILVAQDEPVCERFVRQPNDLWLLSTSVGLDAVLEFASVPVTIPLHEIYAGVEFPQPNSVSL